jgi:hypothetical protein
MERRRAYSNRTRDFHLRYLAAVSVVASHETTAKSHGHLCILSPTPVSRMNHDKPIQAHPSNSFNSNHLTLITSQRHHPDCPLPLQHLSRRPLLQLNLHQYRNHHHNNNHHAHLRHICHPTLSKTIPRHIRKRHDWRARRPLGHR